MEEKTKPPDIKERAFNFAFEVRYAVPSTARAGISQTLWKNLRLNRAVQT
jgi:hypothetical protein